MLSSAGCRAALGKCCCYLLRNIDLRGVRRIGDQRDELVAEDGAE